MFKIVVALFWMGSLGSGGEFAWADFSQDPEEGEPEIVLEVTATKSVVQKRGSRSSTEVNQEQIAKMPMGSEVSLPRLLSVTTPGIVAGPFGQTFVRGNHANIQYQLDGVQLPDSASNTLGQILSPRNIDHLEVITGGIPAEFGQRLSAVVDVTTRSGTEKPSGEIELNYGSYNTFMPHLLVGGANESGNFHYFFSAQYNRTDRGLDTPQPVSTALTDQVQGGTDASHDSAVGNSEFLKLDWQADHANKLSMILFNSESFYQIPTFPSSFNSSDPYFQSGYVDAFGNSQGSSEPTFNYTPPWTNDTQSEINAYSELIWKHRFSNQSVLQLAPYYKYSSIVIGNDPVNDFYSAAVISGASPSSFSQNRHTNNLGLKSDWTWRPNDFQLVKTGFQFQASRSDGTISIQTSSSASPWVDSTPNMGFFEGFYLQDDVTLIRSLILNAGLRLDATQFSFGSLNSTDSMFQPRVGLTYLVTDWTRFHVFYGKLFQPAPVENLRYQFNPTTGNFISLNSYDIQAEKDDYYEVGVSQKIMDRQEISLNAYYKDGRNILDDFQILNTSIAQPFNFTTGFAYGFEISLKGQLNSDWSEYFNYSYNLAMGQGISDIAGDSGPGYQVLDHVQAHTANSGLTYSKSYFWWTGQLLYGSGLRTGEFNSIGLPAHFSFDTTFGYDFHGKDWWSKFRVSGDILNLLDNRYPITIANGFNGSHYFAGRQYFIRLVKEL